MSKAATAANQPNTTSSGSDDLAKASTATSSNHYHNPCKDQQATDNFTKETELSLSRNIPLFCRSCFPAAVLFCTPLFSRVKCECGIVFVLGSLEVCRFHSIPSFRACSNYLSGAFGHCFTICKPAHPVLVDFLLPGGCAVTRTAIAIHFAGVASL